MKDKQKAILVVSFGTSHEETRRKTIDAIEKDIEIAFPECKVYRAFTSKMIIKKLFTTNNIKVNTVSEALDLIIKDGFKEIIVQPTHIINGIENDEMLETLKNYSSKFDSIKVGSPLLSSTKDYNNLINIITNEFSHLKSDEALVCMGHGSSHYANSSYAALDYSFKEKGNKNIFVATVEAYPYIETIIKPLKELNPKKIILMPLMIVAGEHAMNDMTGNEDSWENILKDCGFNVTCVLKGLGEYPQIRQLFIEHIKQSI